VIRLAKKFKVPLVLRYYKQMSYSEIARALKRGFLRQDVDLPSQRSITSPIFEGYVPRTSQLAG